ncbi:MAG: hypothetical protein C4346_08505, partial [Chloroflexota bacterium]
SPEATDYSVEALASAVAECLDALRHAPAVLIGHSLGGAVAMHVALSRPDLVTGLVLVNSAGLGDEISDELVSLMADAAMRRPATSVPTSGWSPSAALRSWHKTSSRMARGPHKAPWPRPRSEVENSRSPCGSGWRRSTHPC